MSVRSCSVLGRPGRLSRSGDQARSNCNGKTEKIKRVQNEVTLSDVGVNVSAFKNILSNTSDFSAQKLGDPKAGWKTSQHLMFQTAFDRNCECGLARSKNKFISILFV